MHFWILPAVLMGVHMQIAILQLISGSKNHTQMLVQLRWTMRRHLSLRMTTQEARGATLPQNLIDPALGWSPGDTFNDTPGESNLLMSRLCTVMAQKSRVELQSLQPPERYSCRIA